MNTDIEFLGRIINTNHIFFRIYRSILSKNITRADFIIIFSGNVKGTNTIIMLKTGNNIVKNTRKPRNNIKNIKVSKLTVHPMALSSDSSISTSLASMMSSPTDLSPISSSSKAPQITIQTPSQEQQYIINNVSQSKNVYVDAVAGAGKTTTIIQLAKQNPNKKILQLTYNKSLRKEVKHKAKDIKNMEIHTYHSFACSYYTKCYNDEHMKQLLDSNLKPKKQFNFDIIVIDEAQDLTFQLFEFCCKIKHDQNHPHTTLVCGDKYQSIYEFKGADHRFLSLAQDVWSNDMLLCEMKESFRVTSDMAKFINKVALKRDRIIANKQINKSCEYIYEDIYERGTTMKIYNIIKQKINEGYLPDDIFILAPSLKNQMQCKELSHILSNNHINVYYPDNDDKEVKDNELKNKIVFSTFHQAKGRERKLVIIYNFDSSYYFSAKDERQDVCSNGIYVAITRASQHLVMVHHKANNTMPFLDTNKLMKYYDIAIMTRKEYIMLRKNRSSVTDLVKYIDECAMNEILPLLESITVTIADADPKTTANIVTTIENNETNTTENISNLTGIALPMMYEHKILKKNPQIEKIVRELCELYKNTESDIVAAVRNEKEHMDNIIDKMKYGEKYLRYANIFISLNDRLIHNLKQINQYDWLNSKNVKICYENMKSILTTESKIEMEINVVENNEKYGQITINGRMDVVNDDCIWELKCVNELTNEHLLQLVVYMWLCNHDKHKLYKDKVFKITNFRTGQIIQLINDHTIVNKIVNKLFECHFGQNKTMSDEEFIGKVNEIKNKYVVQSLDVIETVMPEKPKQAKRILQLKY